jgi:hypothetical protein
MGEQHGLGGKSALEDWEAWLAPQVRQVELLGEIPITAGECAQLGEIIGLRVAAVGHRRALRALRHDYPCTFAVYLVAQGIYGYQGGDYWSEVVQVTGLSGNYTSQIGRAFEQVLEDLGLPLFYDMRADAQRYVSLILAHGGIPDYCLPDFFANMLQPSILRAQYAGMSAAELIDEWRWRSSVQYFTDKPVLHFLACGSQVAEDFVERCREMAWGVLDSGSVPGAEEIGLPKRVVDAYSRWIAEQSTDQMQRELADRWRLRKPDVLVDPWGEGVILNLPPQQVPATMIYADIAWQVKVGEETYTIPVRVRRTGFDLKTEAESTRLNQPSAIYQVSLLADGQVKRTWHFQGVDDERPLLVFDAERSALLSWQYSLPARCLGLLHPARFALQIEGEARLLEELPRMPWGWSDFCGAVWDLSQGTCLRLLKDGEAVLSATLRPDETMQRPYLLGGQLFSPEVPGVRAPVYVGPPPVVRIPLTGRRGLDEELARWRLTVRNKWSAVPEVNATMTLADLRTELAVGERHVDLPLSLPSLLGEAPFGNFVVRLRGPLGRDAEFTMRVVPHLAVCGHETLYLPNVQSGPPSATLLIETVPGDGLECRGEEGECRVQAVERHEGRWVYKVEAGPDVTEVELTISRPLPSGDAVRVPVPLSIRRLRWALVGAQTGPSRREWTGRIIRRSVDALLQTQSPCLLVNLPLDDQNNTHLELRLLDVDGTELQTMDLASTSPHQRMWRFDLSAFLDTIRAGRSPILRFQLGVSNLPGRYRPLHLPVLSLTQTLVVDDVELVCRRADDRVVLELRWHEPTSVRNRHVRFWPLWRPWDPVFERSIPDEVEGMWSFDVPPDRLRSGKYRVEFIVVDPWVSPTLLQTPPKGTPGTADIQLIAPSKQLQVLDTRVQEQGKCFELCLERAVICQDAGDAQGARAGCQWCFEHLDDGTIPQVLALVEQVKVSGDGATLLASQLKMFAPGRIERLLRAYSQGEVSPEHFQRYLRNLPREGRLLPQATCKQLLSVRDDTARLPAVEQLIHRGDMLAVDTVLEWIGAATLSDADAVALLLLNPNLAVECLQGRVEDAAAHRLLDGLHHALAVEGLVQVGNWVHCSAGWGRVECIENPQTRTEIKWITAGQRTGHRLHITLRPDVFAERIVIDLAPSASARFLEAGQVLVCTKCARFSTRCKDILQQHFQEAHPIRSRKGVPQLRYRRCEEAIPLQLLEFTSTEPRNQLV